MYILAIDQGTTGTTTVLYDHNGRPAGKTYREFAQHYPKPGWVEHDPEEIWDSVVATVSDLCRSTPGRIAAIGIANQRETTILWNRRTGKPIHNAVVWQCRRTAGMCDDLRAREEMVRLRTGLPLDAYFSGTKIKWILDHVEDCPPVEDIAFGTIDAWLVWKLTGGSVHATDYTNASRTLLFNIERKQWDAELCDLFGVPTCILPEVRCSVGDYGTVSTIDALRGVPIAGVAGDQQAALFGQCGFGAGGAKSTYGTGCFLLMNTGEELVHSRQGLITTVAVGSDGKPCYALEGSVFIAGAAVQWLRDGLRIIEHAADSEAAALSLSGNDGVYCVPAFVGLGAPHWDPEVRGVLTGLTRGTTRAHIIRAVLESMAYQSYDVLAAREAETECSIGELDVDGGAIANDFLAQFQADILGRRVVRPVVIESTSLGVAYLAGLEIGVWQDESDLRRLKEVERVFEPGMDEDVRERLLAGWNRALRQAMQK